MREQKKRYQEQKYYSLIKNRDEKGNILTYSVFNFMIMEDNEYNTLAEANKKMKSISK